MITTALGRFVSEMSQVTDNDLVFKRLDDVFKDLNENIIPMLAIATTTGKTTDLYVKVDRALKAPTTGATKYRGDLITFLRMIVGDRAKEKEDLVKIFEQSFKQDILKNALTYDTATLLHVLSCLQTWCDYTRRLLSCLVRSEINNPYKPLEKKYLEYCMADNNIRLFTIITDVMSSSWKDFGKAVVALKDISFDPEQEAAMQNMYKGKLDPVKTGYIPLVSDLALFIGSFYNQWYKYWYDRAKWERERLQLQLVYMEQDKAGATPEELKRLQDQIDFYNRRLAELDQKIEDMENDSSGYDYK